MQYSFQTKQIDTLFTAGQKYADKVFQIVNGKSQNVSRKNRRPLTMQSTLALEYFSLFLPKQNRRPKRKPLRDTLALEWFSFSRNV